MDAGVDPAPAPPPFEPEAGGTKLKVRGAVTHFHPGGAVVEFPTANGGAIGIPTDLELELGELVTLEATVLSATREVIRVTFETPEGDGQLAELSRFRCTIVK